MKLLRPLAFAAVLLAPLWLHGQAVNGITAVVNDSVITYDEVETALLPFADVISGQFRGQPQTIQQKMEEARSRQIQEMVDRDVILNHFRKGEQDKKFKFPESLIEQSINEKIRKVYGDRASLMQSLQSHGLTLEKFRQEQRERIIVQAMIQQNVSLEKVIISPYKIESYYRAHEAEYKVGDQVKARTITIPQSAGPAGFAKKLADEVLAKIEGGASFAEMATVYSQDSYRAEGGDRGFIERKGLTEKLSDVAFSLKAHQHSGVIELGDAFYIISIDEAQPAHVKQLTEIRDQIERALQDEEGARLQRRWIERLRKESFIQLYP
jgi:parvulin-like peptidyl-prolyl isomerase